MTMSHYQLVLTSSGFEDKQRLLVLRWRSALKPWLDSACIKA